MVRVKQRPVAELRSPQGLAHSFTRTEAAPPFAIFEGWA
jgi:hypothetical protein